jgi:hypothetical protein
MYANAHACACPATCHSSMPKRHGTAGAGVSPPQPHDDAPRLCCAGSQPSMHAVPPAGAQGLCKTLRTAHPERLEKPGQPQMSSHLRLCSGSWRWSARQHWVRACHGSCQLPRLCCMLAAGGRPPATDAVSCVTGSCLSCASRCPPEHLRARMQDLHVTSRGATWARSTGPPVYAWTIGRRGCTASGGSAPTPPLV